MEKLKRQKFPRLGISLNIPAHWDFCDEGYQKNLWNFYQRLNALRNRVTWPQWRGKLDLFDFKGSWGFCLGIFYRDEQRGFPHFKVQAFMGYKRNPIPEADFYTQAHEETHAADFLNARKQVLDVVDSEMPLDTRITDNILSIGLETFADIGAIYAMRKKGFSFGEIRDIYFQICKKDLAPILLGAFEEARNARL